MTSLRALAVPGALILALLAVAPAARAGQYTVNSCVTSDGGPAGVDGWVLLGRPVPPTSDFSGGAPCASGQGFALILQGAQSSGDESELRFAAPTGTRIAGYSLIRRPSISSGGGAYRYATLEYGSGQASIVESCIGPQPCALLAGQPRLDRSQPAAGTTGIGLALLCASSSGCPKTANPDASVSIAASHVTIQDDSPPVFTRAPSGSLASPTAPITGPASLAFAAHDTGGGLLRSELTVDGATVATTPIVGTGGSCQAPFTSPAPCPSDASSTVTLDTASLPDGPHQIGLRLIDATGTNAVWAGPFTVTTANHVPPPCTGARVPTRPPARLRAFLTAGRGSGARSRHRARLTVVLGHTARIFGRLTGPNGAPLAGESICALASSLGDTPRPTLLAIAKTDRSGAFSIVVGPGPSRHITLIAVPAPTSPAGIAASQLSLGVRPPLTLGVNRHRVHNGQSAVFSGRLGATAVRGSRMLVELQVLDGRHWRTFALTRCSTRGAFRVRYRFTHTSQATRYLFRALAPREGYWPYVTALSRVVALTVRGG